MAEVTRIRSAMSNREATANGTQEDAHAGSISLLVQVPVRESGDVAMRVQAQVRVKAVVLVGPT